MGATTALTTQTAKYFNYQQRVSCYCLQHKLTRSSIDLSATPHYLIISHEPVRDLPTSYLPLDFRLSSTAYYPEPHTNHTMSRSRSGSATSNVSNKELPACGQPAYARRETPRTFHYSRRAQTRRVIHTTIIIFRHGHTKALHIICVDTHHFWRCHADQEEVKQAAMLEGGLQSTCSADRRRLRFPPEALLRKTSNVGVTQLRGSGRRTTCRQG